MSLPVLISFSTYGSHLPGRSRGSFHHATGKLDANHKLEAYVGSNLSQAEIVLTLEERKIVFDAISDYCWKNNCYIGALNIRTNHVHLLVALSEGDPKEFCRTIKAMASRRLFKYSSRFGNNKDCVKGVAKIWTRNSNIVYVYDKEKWVEGARYILERQGANDYLTEKEWLLNSMNWIPTPFDLTVPWYVVFNGKKLTWEHK